MAYGPPVLDRAEIDAPPTVESFRANRDPAMEAILACLGHVAGW